MKNHESLCEISHLLNLQRSRITAVMTLILSLLALYACLMGVLDKSIYQDVLEKGTITQFLLVASTGQDIIFIPLALLLALFSIMFLVRPGYKSFIIILGLTGNFFYGYGLYTMQGLYTSIYLVYLAIFSLSIYSLVLGLLSFTSEIAEKTLLPRGLRIFISIFLFSIVFMLGLVWILRISPDIVSHIPPDTYGVFVLDLGIVFPAIAITATKLIRNRPYGNILAGVALIKALTVCLSWGFGEWYGRLYGGIQGSYDMLIIPSVLTLISLVLVGLYINKLKII